MRPFHPAAFLLLCCLTPLSAGPLSGCSTNPSTGRSQFILLPADQVAAMGVEATPQMIAEFGGEVRSAELRGYINDVGRRVAAEVEPEFARIDWQFYVLDSEVVNAFALPGGRVFITKGLLQRFDNEAQVAGVLGHEIGHVTARHVDERLSQAMVAQFGVGVLGAYSESTLITEGAGMLTQVGLLKFSRDQESEADTQGLKYMTKAAYDPEGMFQVLEVLLEVSAGQPRQPEFLATHPHPDTRVVEIREAINGQYAFTQGNSSYSLQAARFLRRAAPYLGGS